MGRRFPKDETVGILLLCSGNETPRILEHSRARAAASAAAPVPVPVLAAIVVLELVLAAVQLLRSPAKGGQAFTLMW